MFVEYSLMLKKTEIFENRLFSLCYVSCVGELVLLSGFPLGKMHHNAHAHTRTHGRARTRTHTHIHRHTHTCARIHTYTYIHAHIHTYTHACMHIYALTYIQIHTYLHTDTYPDAYAHIPRYIHTNSYTHLPIKRFSTHSYLPNFRELKEVKLLTLSKLSLNILAWNQTEWTLWSTVLGSPPPSNWVHFLVLVGVNGGQRFENFLNLEVLNSENFFRVIVPI